MLWAVIYFSVLFFLLIAFLTYDLGNSDEPGLMCFVFAWPVTLPYVVIITTCYWIAKAIRRTWGFVFG